MIPSNENPGAFPGAISRVDDSTEICSRCGTLEGYIGRKGFLSPEALAALKSARTLLQKVEALVRDEQAREHELIGKEVL